MSTTIVIKRVLRSSADDMYAMFAEPTALNEVPGARIELLEPGSRDGTGVLRRVALRGGVVLIERIVSLDPHNRRFSYRIEDSRPHFEHEHGEITFSPVGAGCQATWTPRIALPAGHFTPVAERIARGVAATGFSTALLIIDAHLRRVGKRNR